MASTGKDIVTVWTMIKVNAIVYYFPCTAPTSVTASATSPTSIDISWELPAGSTADEFIINYNFTIRQCVDDGVQQVMITPVNGFLRSYTISNSSTTPVEEDSEYTITVSTVSNGITSEPSNPTRVTTEEAGT